jgi:hypothetical protein
MIPSKHLYSSVIVIYQPAICRIKAKLKSGEMYVRGDQWPLFLYDDCRFDAENPWKGLLRNQLLILVRRPFILSLCMSIYLSTGIQARLYIAELCRP